MTISEFFSLCFTAILAENVVLTQVFGIDALGKKAGSVYKVCLGMLPVMTVSTAVAWVCNTFLLSPLGLKHLQLVVFTALAALFAFLFEKLYNSLTNSKVNLTPLVTFNCALISVMLDSVWGDYNLLGCIVLGLSSALGFALALAVFHGVKQRLVLAGLSPSFEGAPVTLLAIGLVVMVFMGFADVELGDSFLAPFKLLQE